MKKLFLTTLLLVGFGGVSFANTIVLNEAIVSEIKIETNDEPQREVLPYCTVVFLQTYATFVQLGLEADALGEAQAAYSECMAGN